MLNQTKLFDAVLEHFSKWLAIKRKPNTTIGGKLMKSATEITCSANDDLKDYIDSYFISYYKDKVYTIPYLLHKIYVGNIIPKQIVLNYPNFEIVEDFTVFCNQKNNAYYEKNFIFFHSADVPIGATVRFTVDANVFNQTTVEHVVWNAFDEFAMYVGLKRYTHENNADLFTRILAKAQTNTNGTEDGIKNALYAALLNLAPISQEDIVIEPLDEKYAHFELEGKSLIEHLAIINKDIYQQKFWNQDYWMHDIENNHYISPQYNTLIEAYKSGVGDDDDLLVVQTGQEELIELKVESFNMSEEKIASYFKTNTVSTDVAIDLYQPQNVIEPVKGQIKIDATQTYPIATDNVSLEFTHLTYINDYIDLYPLIKDKSLVIIRPRNPLYADRTYRFKVEPTSLIKPFQVKAKVANDERNLLQEKPGTFFSEANYLEPSLCKKYINTLSQIDYVTNMIHKGNGFGLNSAKNKGQFGIRLTDTLKRSKLFFTQSIEALDDIDSRIVSSLGFTLNDKIYTSIVNEYSKLEFTIEANQVRFCTNGACYVKFYDEDTLIEYESETSDTFLYPHSPSQNPHSIRVSIYPTTENVPLIISELQYCSFNINLALEKGVLEKIENGYLLPDDEENVLRFEVLAHTSHTPICSPIYFGEPLIDVTYVSDSFILEAGKTDIDFEAINCKCMIQELNTDGSIAAETIYKSTQTFFAYHKTLLELDLSQFHYVENIYTNIGFILKKDNTYFLELPPNTDIEKIGLTAQKMLYKKIFSLTDLLGPHDACYLSPLVKGFLCQKGNKIEKKVIQLPAKVGYYNLVNTTPYKAQLVLQNGETICGSISNLPLSSFYFDTPEAVVYTAYNSYTLYQEDHYPVAIEKVFMPFLPDNYETFYYELSCGDSAIDVCFYNEHLSFDATRNYTIGIPYLHYKIKSELLSRLYQYHTHEIIPMTFKAKRIPFDDHLLTSDQRIIDLTKYVIKTNEDFTVKYAIADNVYPFENPIFVDSEAFYIETDAFKKLKRCQVNTILYIGFTPYQEGATSNIELYVLYSQSGVLIFDATFVAQHAGKIVYVVYNYLRPVSIEISAEKFYNIVEHEITTYEKVDEKSVLISNTATTYDLNNLDLIKGDMIVASIPEPGYVTTLKDSLVYISNYLEEHTLALHSGYYYCNEKEYYLFSSNKDFLVTHNDYILSHCVESTEEGEQLYPKANNFLKNSAMSLEDTTLLHLTDFKKSPIENVNYMLRLGACEQLSVWQNYGMKTSLTEGKYSQGLRFYSTFENGYAILPLTQLEKNSYTLSAYITGDAAPYLLKAVQWEKEVASNFALYDNKLPLTRSEKDIYSITFEAEPDAYYYLYLEGEGLIDDIILCNSTAYTPLLHTKNLNLIPYTLDTKKEHATTRYLFNKQQAYSGTVEISKEGDLLPKTSVTTGITEIFSLFDLLSNLTQGFTYIDNIYVPKDSYSFFTPILELPNYDFIDSIYFNTNIYTENDLEITVYTGNSKDYLQPIQPQKGKVAFLKKESIGRFVKVQVHMQKNTYLSHLNIGCKYISTKDGGPKLTYPNQQVLISQWFDLNEEGTYLLERLNFKAFKNCMIHLRYAKNPAVPTDYQQLILSSTGELRLPLQIEKARYIQFKVQINYSTGCFNMNYFDITRKD